ncbi:MAG: S8 family serine peptidase [Cyclobacteriaceae bacterium]|nr:S8 family serine peptidase [Cyclobacteriaceae bacterium]
MKNRVLRNIAILIALVSDFVPVTQTVGQELVGTANRSYLLNLSKELKEEFEINQASVAYYALERSLLLREKMENGSTVSLIRIMPSGLPEYYKSHNQNAAINVGTVRLRPRADLGLNLTGKNILIGIWDSGSTNVEHQEFEDRVEIKDNIPFDDHGTHVAGTIAAAGINPNAKGMAYEAQVIAYEFNNDNSEMALEAANGLIISNHSYGLRTGWDVNSAGTGWQWFGDPSVSNVEDYRFGYYDNSNSRVWDDIAFNAPYYLIIKSAGNDRTDVGDGTRAPDGPYDCLEPKSVAKNILTIGAVAHLSGTYTNASDVIMSEFSSWGPTDDGRIKPDISAIGVDVFSALSDGVNSYGLLSGTSMSAPNTTGSLALLQEYYAQLNGGTYMRSATLKALAIHSANEAGDAPGPDYEFGWGLLAVDKAANIITRNDGIQFLIKEATLNNNDSLVYKINASGTAPLVATICWTDVPGTPAAVSLNPTTLMLVNDLDLRVYDPSKNPTLPWILDPANPDRAATRGDNFRDNVEKIEIATPLAGEYTIVIKHKNQLRNGRQAVSVVVTSAPVNPTLTRLFWIGGSGDWNNPAKWSLNSGGAPANTVPGFNNPVIFDDNSFSAANNTINMTAAANSYNINYYTTDSVTINMASFTMTIDGSVFDENNKLRFNNGKVSFRGNVSKNNQLRVASGAFNNVDLEFLSINGSWNIVNSVTAKSIKIENSSIFARNKTISTASINILLNSGNSIDFSGSTLEGLNQLVISPNARVVFTGSEIKLSNVNGVSAKAITADASVFHNISIDNADLQMSGSNRLNAMKLNGTATLNGSNTIDSLILSTISSLNLQGNSVQTINKYFAATGIAANRIEITSAGPGNASLFADNSNIRFCLDYLNVTNVSVSGNTDFLSGDNSLIDANSIGWIKLDCEDALFPSFEIANPCAMGETKFIDTSTGNPTSWTWDFGDLQFPLTNASTLQNPTHQFMFEGIHHRV